MKRTGKQADGYLTYAFCTEFQVMRNKTKCILNSAVQWPLVVLQFVDNNNDRKDAESDVKD
jgi:hypothetical protein